MLLGHILRIKRFMSITAGSTFFRHAFFVIESIFAKINRIGKIVTLLVFSIDPFIFMISTLQYLYSAAWFCETNEKKVKVIQEMQFILRCLRLSNGWTESSIKSELSSGAPEPETKTTGMKSKSCFSVAACKKAVSETSSLIMCR